ncbi:MAG: alanine--glyoxylate aminotransferase family protein [Chloroflexi bacterium]|nr:alanine--glyoxylate aminotransferase family protein [Chloroflexota bacterium]
MPNLRVPGPTPCPEDVLEAVGGQMINHRGPEFKEIITRAHGRLQQVFATKNDVLIMTTSGTGGMEAAVVNVLSPGDKVLNVSVGVFGDRFAQIAERYGATVIKLSSPLGQAADPAAVRKALQANPDVKAVTVTHNETSTGVTNDLEAIAKVVKSEFGKLLVVDAISSLGCIPLLTDAWSCDVVATASQKGFMIPPGLAFISVSPAAWQAAEKNTTPRFYFDFARHKSYYQRGQTPWTPAVSIMYGLDLSLDKMLKEGMTNVYARHARIGRQVREGAKALGLQLLPADERYASNTVTAVRVPAGVEGAKLTGLLRQEHGVVVAGGQGPLEGKIIRIGHMGYVSEADIQDVLTALKASLTKLGFKTSAVPTS